MVGIANKLKSRGLRGSDSHAPTWTVLLDERRAGEIVPGNELDAYFTTNDRSAVLRKHHLECLRTMMSGAMELRCAEQRDIIGLTEIIHQLWDELLRRQATEASVLRGDDDVEAAIWVRDLATALDTS